MQTKIVSRMFGSLAMAAVLAMPALAQSNAQSKGMSDAQVESNVLKAFAADNRLANQAINTSTVFGTVTLTGSVNDEAARDAAEQIAARTDGVKKVVDQLTVGAPPAQAAGVGQPNSGDYDPAAQNVLPGNGEAMSAQQGAAAAAAMPQADPNNGNQPPQYQQQAPQYNQQPQYGQGQPQYSQQPPAYGDPNAPQGQYPPQQGQYPQGQPGGYPPPPPQGRLYRRDLERGYAQGAQQGQPGGTPVTVPQGAVLAVRINRWISSGDAAPGSTFSAIVSEDVVAGNQIAIPRGATVYGTVVDAKGAGALKGRGELTLQLNTLELGGQRYTLQSDPFTVHGRDKTAQSVGSTIFGAAAGALIGGAIGRGAGAAIGAGVGGAAGLGASAASNGGQANLPPEALLRFRLDAPLPLTTVSEAEMQRLGGYAGPQRPPVPPPPPGYRVYPGYYGYYGAYYR